MIDAGSRDCGFLRDVLACPACWGDLYFSPGMIQCSQCGCEYPQPSADWVDLSPPGKVFQSPEGWLQRQDKCETWYRELITDPEHAYHTLRFDLDPFGEMLATLAGDILDVGGGVGVVRDYLPAARRYVSLDPSLEWLRTDWSALAGYFPSLQTIPCFVRATAEKLPFRSESFDVAIALWSLNHVEDASTAVQEIARVLRPSGSALLVLEDMSPRWMEFLGRRLWSTGVGHTLRLLRTRVQCLLPGRRWPLQDDHYRIGDRDVDQWQRPLFHSMDRAWRGRYLSYELKDRRPTKTP